MKIHSLWLTTLALFTLLVPASSVLARSWELDPAHSNVYFSIDHIYSKVQGNFQDISATIDFDPAQPSAGRFSFAIKVDSINTGIAKRDKHLLSNDFFDSSAFPIIKFTSTSVSDSGNGQLKITGKLNIKGKEHDLVLPLHFAGIKDHPAAAGKQVIGFNGRLTLDRLALNVGSGKYYEKGLVGKDVEVLVSIEALAAK